MKQYQVQKYLMEPITVLYVDDDSSLLDIGTIYLERMGSFKVDTAFSANDALKMLISRRYDAIISDYEMPRMNGIDFLKEVRKEYPTLPFIIFTGRGREEIVIEAINSGANFYLQKGGDPRAQFTELIHKVRQAVQSSQSDAALRESEERFRQIFNSVNDAIHIHEIRQDGLPGKFLDMNDAACRMLQYERVELFTKTPLDFAMEKHSIPLDKIGNTFKKEGTVIFETTHIRKDGTLVPVEIHAHVATLGGKKVVVSVIRDITERVRENRILHAEIELSGDLQRVRGITETLDACLTFALSASGLEAGEIYLIDPADGCLNLVVSRNVPSEIRVSVARFLPDTAFARMVAAGTPCYFAAGNSTLLRSGAPESSGARASAFIPINVEERTIGCLALTTQTKEEISPHARIALSTVATVIGIAIERARAEEKREANEARLVAVMEIGSLAWWEMELPQGRVRFDPRKATILGYLPDRFTHYIDFTNLVHPDDSERTLKAMRDHLVGKKPRYQTDYRIRAADGSYHWFRDVGGITGTSPEGVPHIVTGIAMDITAIKGMETELAEKHEELQTAFEQLTSTEAELQANYAELEKSHALLARSEEQFRSLFDNMSEGLAAHELVFGTDGKVEDYRLIAVNPAFGRILGINPDAVMGKTGREAYKTPDSPYLDIFSRVARSGIPEFFVTYFPPMDRHFRISVYSPKKDQFVTVFSDISEDVRREEILKKKNADLESAYEELTSTEEELRQNLEELGRSQQDLRKSEEKYRQIVETTHEGIWIFDSDHKITYVNTRMAEMHGYAEKEMIGRPITNFVHPDDCPTLDTELGNRRQGISGHMEDRHVKKDGSVIWVQISSTPLMGQNGKFYGAFAMLTDITERKCAEVALAENHRMIDTLIRNLPGMVYRCKNDPDWTMEFASGGCRDLTGYSPEEVIANHTVSYGSLIVPEDRERVGRAVQEGITNRQPFVMEYRIAARDGNIKAVWEKGRGIFDEKGELVALEGYIFDNTERWRADMALRQANRQLNLLSGITRHDILNNVTSIRGYLALADEASRDPPVKAFLKKIESVTLSVKDQIEFTKIYKDLGTHDPQWQVLEKVLANLAVPPGISFHNWTAGLELYADPLLEKVFYNLLDNTLRHGEKADRIRITCKKSPEGLVLLWEDNGAGIPRENKEAIFDKGFGKNTGLGLFLVREILSITGITIRETGAAGSGACFEIAVPNGAFRFAHTSAS